MRKPLIKNTRIVFRTSSKTYVGKVVDTYVKNRRRLYSVEAEHGTVYDNLPADSTTSPEYMIDTELTEDSKSTDNRSWKVTATTKAKPQMTREIASLTKPRAILTRQEKLMIATMVQSAQFIENSFYSTR